MAWMFWNAINTPSATRWLLVAFDIVFVASLDSHLCMDIAVAAEVIGGALFPIHLDWEVHSIQEH